MSNYVKPMVVAADEIAEGVFMASGSGNGNGNGDTASFTYTLTNDYGHEKHYSFSATNTTDAAVDSITATVGCIGNVTEIIANTKVSAQIDGDKAILTISKNYGQIEPGESVTGMIYVKGNGEVGIQ